jgi:hypothetical protein
VNKADVQTQRVSDISAMPAGLVNSLARDEILNLLAFLEAGASTEMLPASNSQR